MAIDTYDGRRLQGSVSEAAADHFVLTNDGRSVTLTYAEVRRVRESARLSRTVKAILIGGAFAGL